MPTENTSRFFHHMQFQHVFRQINTEHSIFYAWFEAMHTRIDIALCHLSEEDSIVLMDKICNETKRIEQMSDRFNPQSEISEINMIAAIEPLTISVELYSILKDCIHYNNTTFGAFDISIHSFNNHRQGISDIILDQVSTTVFFKDKNVQIDLCGYIKGYALDKVRGMLTDNNCSNALVNFGNSSVCGIGNHPYGKGWKINLPNQEKDSATLFNQCLTNSGNSADYFHIIHPETGQLCKSDNIMSVITEKADIGEVLSTALYVCDSKHIDLICGKLGGTLLTANF